VAATSHAAPRAGAGPRDVDALIVGVLQDLGGASRARRGASTFALENGLVSQLAAEERDMRRHAYPLAEGHEAAHALLLSQVRRILHGVRSSDATAEAARLAVRAVAIRFHAHVLAHDVALAGFLRRCRAR